MAELHTACGAPELMNGHRTVTNAAHNAALVPRVPVWPLWSVSSFFRRCSTAVLTASSNVRMRSRPSSSPVPLSSLLAFAEGESAAGLGNTTTLLRSDAAGRPFTQHHSSSFLASKLSPRPTKRLAQGSRKEAHSHGTGRQSHPAPCMQLASRALTVCCMQKSVCGFGQLT